MHTYMITIIHLIYLNYYLHMFQQSYHPRVLRETLRPFPVNVDLKDGV